MKEYKDALKLIEKYDTIIIHRHKKPDGDALGSQVGLKHLILDNFEGKKVYTVGDEAGHYSCMDDTVMDEIGDETYNGALAVLVDTAAVSLASDMRYTLAAETLRFDHHLFCGKMCDVEVIDTSRESCAGLIADFAQKCNWKISPLAAKLLYTGIATDSGRFLYDSTTPETLRIAADLLELGINLNDIFVPLYASEFSNVKLRAEFVLKIKFTEHNVAYIYTDRAETERLRSQGVKTFTIYRDMVSVMADIKGVNVWVNFAETEDGVMCELRSNKYNINKIAVKYGGGGHAKASGACLPNRETAMAMLADLDALMQ